MGHCGIVSRPQNRPISIRLIVFAVVYISDFFLQALLRSEPESKKHCIALADASLPKITIVQATGTARLQGVVAGLTPSQAAARCPHLLIKNRSLAQETSATEILLQTAYAFSPCIESTGPGICTLDVKGLGLDDEDSSRQWAKKLSEALGRFHLQAKIGFGSNPQLALILAQAAAPILWVKDAKTFIETLPLSALHSPSEIQPILDLWGIKTIGAFTALGKNQIAERLGAAAVQVFEILANDRPLVLVSPPEHFIERMDFEHEIETTEPLLFALNRFLQQLALRLECIHLVVAELHLELVLASGENYRHIFKIPAATNNLQVLFRMVQTHLESVRTDSPIVALELKAEPGKAERHQFGLFDATLRDPNQFAETLARLVALCGAENVGTPEIISSHRPDAFRLKTPVFSTIGKSASNIANTCRQGPQLRRFRPVLTAYVEFRHQQPALVRSSCCNGAIASLRGPFTSSGNWWEKSQSWNRAEWDVQMNDGKIYRIFRSEEGCFVEGVYD